MSSALVDLLLSRCAGGVALALSGGCDSALLLAVLARLRQEKDFPFLAVHIQTPLQTTEEAERCRRLAARFQVELVTVSPDVLTLPAVCGNRRDRCYHCKKMIFQAVLAAAEERQIPLVIDGTNADDCKEYRPGRQALAELGIFSPLAEAGLTKPQVRQLGAEYGLEEAHLPASACLATRFPYDVSLTIPALERVARAEAFLRSIVSGPLRVRVHGDLARIEVEKAEFSAVTAAGETIEKTLKKLGFQTVTLDLSGFRSGSFDF